MSYVAAIQAIFKILKVVSSIRDLLGGNATNVITVADLERVVRGENARFFTTIAFADIETIHNQFYRNWLPSVTNLGRDITADDINLSSGPLHHVFQDLIRVRTELSVLLNRVREVFRTHQRDLHVDELVGGILTFMHGFGLLFHVHGVYAELRRIQIGAATLSDRNLVTDTRAALQYLADAETALNLFLTNSTAQNRRLDMITPLRRSSGTNLNPPRYSFTDNYSARSSTPADTSLFVWRHSQTWVSESHARDMRNQHVGNVNNRMGVVFVNPANDVRGQYASLHVTLNARLQAQGGTWIITKAIMEKLEAGDLEERTGEFEDGSVVPVNAEEFIALSEKLRQGAAGEGSGDN